MTVHDETHTTPAEAKARDAVQSLGAPPPDPAFRARLGRQFATGSIPEPRRIVPGPWFTRPAVWGPLATAAGLVLALGWMNRAPDWRVVTAIGDGVALVNGKSVPVSHTDELSALLRRGGHIQMPSSASLDLVSPGQVAVSLAPGAEIVLPGPPNRLWKRHAEIDLALGDAFFETGRAFHGASLEVKTHEATAHVVGTSFAVLCQPGGTCVCVMEGRVRVTHAGDAADVVMVRSGTRRMCYDDYPSQSAPILQYSEHALHRLRGSAARALGR